MHLNHQLFTFRLWHKRQRLQHHVQSLELRDLAKIGKPVPAITIIDRTWLQRRLIRLPIFDHHDPIWMDSPLDVSLPQKLTWRNERINQTKIALKVMLAQPEVFGSFVRKTLAALIE